MGDKEMNNKNIEYKTKQISEYYSDNRQKWDEFYPSERWVFERIAGEKKFLGDVLDVGCACGGLGTALSKKFLVNSYTGVDINKDAIDWAINKHKLDIPTTFICGDIIKINFNNLYDTVISLSCADWNLRTEEIIDTCWKLVKPNGNFIISLRLTNRKGINDIKKSYQYINFSGNEADPELANYVVFNFKEALEDFKELVPRPELIGAYGYWGKPSNTAVTPFEKLIFTVFYIKKGSGRYDSDIKAELTLPLEIFL